ncbi:MAG: prepilin peptidase [Lachnospiraceae bacterium]|nr:prepilin peptidase [Lachnospiraceae bacterium]
MAADCAGLLFLAGLTAEDIRKKEIPVFKVLAAGFFAVLYPMCVGQISAQEIIWGLVPGGILMLLALITKESIGYGDGMVAAVLGLWTGGWFTLAVVCAAVMLSGIYGTACLIRKKREPIPFIPFLLLGMEVVLAYG